VGGKYYSSDWNGERSGLTVERASRLYLQEIGFSSSIRRIAASPAGSYKPDPLFALYPYVPCALLSQESDKIQTFKLCYCQAISPSTFQGSFYSTRLRSAMPFCLSGTIKIPNTAGTRETKSGCKISPSRYLFQ
jgi:hypothetical protein